MSARIAKFGLAFCCGVALLCQTAYVNAQVPGGGNNNNGDGNDSFFFSTGVVGGVKVDPAGVLSGQKDVVDQQVKQKLLAGLANVDADINAATDLRMISLRGLEAAINEARTSNKPLPKDVQFMAGLQRIEYVILSPETNDVIIAGPGEGWTVSDDGNVVGVKTGAPVIQLEDFLVAMRSVDEARQGQGISVSIDPTEQGVRQLQQLFKQMKTQQVNFRPHHQRNVEEAMGQHKITLTGVPQDSRFSQILVAADYKMKRLSMGLEKAPIDGLPSFMEMAVAKKAKRIKAAPRFWMECSYEPVAKTEDGSIWQIRGKGVKTLTQESHFDSDGKRKTTAKQNRFAADWANLMTEKFEELSAAEPAFRELRNVMDLSVIAAIIKKEQLAEKVNLELPAILGTTQVVSTPAWSVPKSVSTECSFVKLQGEWLVSASGGIQLDSWGVAGNSEVVAELASVATKANEKTADRWWWNAE